VKDEWLAALPDLVRAQCEELVSRAPEEADETAAPVPTYGAAAKRNGWITAEEAVRAICENALAAPRGHDVPLFKCPQVQKAASEGLTLVMNRVGEDLLWACNAQCRKSQGKTQGRKVIQPDDVGAHLLSKHGLKKLPEILEATREVMCEQIAAEKSRREEKLRREGHKRENGKRKADGEPTGRALKKRKGGTEAVPEAEER
jgi:hypothetical protein